MENIDTSLSTSPQLEIREQSGVAVALSHKQILSLFKKSEQSGIPFDTLQEVYKRGYSSELTEQAAFNRVNSFIAGGAAREMDKDLYEKRGLWDNIHAKRERIKHGSGEHMRKPGSKGAPTDAALKASQATSESAPCWSGYKQVGMKMKNNKQVPNCVPEAANPAQQAAIAIAMKKAGKKPQNETYTGAEPVSPDTDNPASRFVGTDQLTKTYMNATPGYSSKLSTIKKVVREQYVAECNGQCTCGQGKDIKETENWQHSKYKNPEGGLTKAGVMAYRREHPGSKLKTAVTTEPSKLKKGSKAANRRKSFCARMGGMKKRLTSAKTAHDPNSRINKALRKWHC